MKNCRTTEPIKDGARSPSRRRLLGMGLAGGAAALTMGTLGSTVANADIVDTLGHFLDLDPIVINFAYELEELQADFFERALISNAFEQLSPREQSAISVIAMQDRQQFEALGNLIADLHIKSANTFESPTAAYSRSPRKFRFPGSAFNSRAGLLKEAIEIKRLSVESYHGSVDLIDRKYLTAAAGIAGVDGRHLAVLLELDGQDPVPTAFETAVSPQTTGRLLGKYGFRGGGKR